MRKLLAKPAPVISEDAVLVDRLRNALEALRKQHTWGDIDDDRYRVEKREIERKLADIEPRPGVTVEMIDLRRAGELLKDLGRLWDHPGVTGETKKQFIEEAFERIEIDELGIRAVQFAEDLVPLAAVSRWWEMERGTGFEPATLCLGSRCSAS